MEVGLPLLLLGAEVLLANPAVHTLPRASARSATHVHAMRPSEVMVASYTTLSRGLMIGIVELSGWDGEEIYS